METTAVATKTKWTLDPTHSELTFSVRHLMITNVKGEFRNFNAEIESEGDDFTKATVKVDVEANSIFTNNEDRDNHLKSEDFFDAEKYATMTFEGKSLEIVDGGNYKLTGDLTIKDVTKEISLDVEFGGIAKDPWGNEKSGFSLSGKLNRKDFGLNWNTALETGGVLVGDDVKIAGEVQFTRKQD